MYNHVELPPHCIFMKNNKRLTDKMLAQQEGALLSHTKRIAAGSARYREWFYFQYLLSPSVFG